MHLFSVKDFTDKDTEVFQSDLKLIFDFIRCSKDKNKLIKLVEGNSEYREMDEDAYDMVMLYTNTKELMTKKADYKKGEKLDMCEAIRGLMEDAQQIGMEQGIERGRSEGLEVGRSEGRTEGEGRIQTLISKMCEAGESEKLAMLADKAFYEEMLRKYGL